MQQDLPRVESQADDKTDWSMQGLLGLILVQMSMNRSLPKEVRERSSAPPPLRRRLAPAPCPTKKPVVAEERRKMAEERQQIEEERQRFAKDAERRARDRKVGRGGREQIADPDRELRLR